MLSRSEFQFVSYTFDQAERKLELTYAFKDAEQFTETLIFPSGIRELSADDTRALDSAFRLYFLLAGVSYYKAAIPPRIVCKAFDLDRDTASFCEKVYRLGLGEFSYRNNVKLDFVFEHNDCSHNLAVPLHLPHRLLVPVGGGKDSTVSIEALRKAGHEIALIASGGKTLAQPIVDTMRVSGMPSFHVQRMISPKLLELNAQGALNGHVPITAILSSLVVICSILYGYDTIVQSNESSANEGNVQMDGIEINHQYSKSFAFEKDFDDYVRAAISPNIKYFSLLRPLSETAIAARFAKNCSAYFPVFRSCNTAFRQEEAKRGKVWCCNCPKCRFVYLALAAFLDKEEMIGIFGKDMLDDERQIEGFRELCGLSGHKPFECVGEIAESAVLMLHLSKQAQWKENKVVSMLADELGGRYVDPEEVYKSLFTLREPHQVPEQYLKALANANF